MATKVEKRGRDGEIGHPRKSHPVNTLVPLPKNPPKVQGIKGGTSTPIANPERHRETGKGRRIEWAEEVCFPMYTKTSPMKYTAENTTRSKNFPISFRHMAGRKVGKMAQKNGMGGTGMAGMNEGNPPQKHPICKRGVRRRQISFSKYKHRPFWKSNKEKTANKYSRGTLQGCAFC